MPTRLAGRLLHLLLVGPRRVGPRLYDFYAHHVVARAPLATAVFARLAQTPDFLPHYLYLNLGGALAIDPASARLFVAGKDGLAFRPVADVRTCTGGRRGLGYRLRIEFSDGSRWCARTLVSIEPLHTAEGLLGAALKREVDGVPPPVARPAGIGQGLRPAG